MVYINLICYVVALVLFVLTGFGVPSSRYSLLGFGLAFLTLPLLLGVMGVT